MRLVDFNLWLIQRKNWNLRGILRSRRLRHNHPWLRGLIASGVAWNIDFGRLMHLIAWPLVVVLLIVLLNELQLRLILRSNVHLGSVVLLQDYWG